MELHANLKDRGGTPLINGGPSQCIHILQIFKRLNLKINSWPLQKIRAPVNKKNRKKIIEQLIVVFQNIVVNYNKLSTL